MCVPDTTYGATLVATRGLAADVPTVTYEPDFVLEYMYSEVSAALDYMKESQDNRGKCSQDFEYIATEDKYVFDIHPVFWGNKFVKTNFVGVWYYNGSEKVDLPPFWTDASSATDNWPGDGRINITSHVEAHYTNRYTNSGWQTVSSTDNQITTIKYNGQSPDKFKFPSYKIVVPVGMKWGLYLQTKTTQNNDGKDIRWYSNAEYNVNNCSAAASFEFGGINYVSFEDAPNPYNCSYHDNSSGTGGHRCNGASQNFGHYDHDMNDIVLAITPHPIESTYRAISYRVMCEDLGGTFDWDFNDLVLDVIYEEGKSQTENATTKIKVVAVGGTLPIELIYTGNYATKDISNEIHSWFGQTPDEDGKYKPINVDGSHTQTPSKVAYTIIHGWTETDKYDVRDVVKQISVKVADYSTVVFPKSDGGDIPQCFMCPTNVDWSDELVNIKDTYSDFPAWVASQGTNAKWYESEIGRAHV